MTEFAIRVLQAPLGSPHLFSLGQAGYILKSASGQLLGIDLYLSDCVERVEGHMGFKRMLPRLLQADDLAFTAVVATHPHRDHFDIDAMPALLANGKTRLFASVDCQKDAEDLALPGDHITYVKPGDRAQVGDFSLHFLPCDHGPAAPDAFGVLVEVDGKTILECGDTCLHLDWAGEYTSHGPVDVLIGPINGMYGNMSEADFAALSGALSPGLTIPCHYGMFASHMGSPGLFYQLMQKHFPENALLIMAQGEALALETITCPASARGEEGNGERI